MRMELVAVSPVSVSGPNHSGAKLWEEEKPKYRWGLRDADMLSLQDRAETG